MNAHRGRHSLFRQSIRGIMSFFGNPNPKFSRFNTRRGCFFHYCCKLVHGRVQKTMLQHVQRDIIHIFECLQILLHVIQDVQCKPLVSIAVTHLPVNFGQFQECVHIHEYKCVFGKGGSAIFLTLMGGGSCNFII